VIPNGVARYWDLLALSDRQPARVLGPQGVLRDRPGFEIELLSRGSIPDAFHADLRHAVLMPMRGHGRLRLENGPEPVLNPGDTALVKPGARHALAPAMTGEAPLYRVIQTDDPAGATGRRL
jgi:hypothetical protein